MKTVVDIEKHGKLTVYRNFISGGLKIYLNDFEFNKDSANTYSCKENGKYIKAEVIHTGFEGAQLKVLGKTLVLSIPISVYMILISLISLLFSLIFGTIPFFSEHGFYVLGGVYGAAIGLVITYVGLYISALPRKGILFKILLIILINAITIGALIGIGFGIA